MPGPQQLPWELSWLHVGQGCLWPIGSSSGGGNGGAEGFDGYLERYPSEAGTWHFSAAVISMLGPEEHPKNEKGTPSQQALRVMPRPRRDPSTAPAPAASQEEGRAGPLLHRRMDRSGFGVDEVDMRRTGTGLRCSGRAWQQVRTAGAGGAHLVVIQLLLREDGLLVPHGGRPPAQPPPPIRRGDRRPGAASRTSAPARDKQTLDPPPAPPPVKRLQPGPAPAKLLQSPGSAPSNYQAPGPPPDPAPSITRLRPRPSSAN